ncbi:UDP-glucose:Glyco protein glucosyltransferase-domain-containing protein [Sphaerosporella brunnea]|uniref:UDP-glucose:Glyco protein glucosyltransferase-domain-containing protein n=1 Tax=Sphaerosporella brunnea TaxID=1250544 RepID=A0A5J5F194_9PEZI|nr:UDP-glucose:Glyco protein glucosyltransferase-domain-containing protein [Sphaerosporella brunnea]
MRLLRAETLLLLAPFLAAVVGANPAINVGLKASWNSAPFLLELLETIAEENKASYFPLLDHIASGAFAGKTSDKELYNEFLRVANAEGFLNDPVELSSFNLALSVHAAAPRVEAHYHYYENNLVPLMGKLFDPACKAWVLWSSKQTCELEGEFNDMIAGVERFPNDRRKLQFDRALEKGDDKPAAILYADIGAPEFQAHHKRLKRYAEAGHISYRLRYRPPVEPSEKPVLLSGYGVSLALKKTDYMVMDDRDVEGDAGKDKAAIQAVEPSTQQLLGALADMESHDIKPLQKEDLAELGYKAATFIMGSQNPFETLQRLVQDFPKHAASIAATDANPNVTEELRSNWEMTFGPGKNIMWINGLRMDESQINVFALLEHLRRERKYIDGFRNLGLDASETVQLLSHSILAGAKEEEQVLRFDYRDDIEGGDVIVWLNDLEKDNRYKEWSNSPMMLLRRVFPGQLHPIRKNVHNLVIPVDFTSKEDLALISQNLKMFVERKIAMRFGLAPRTKTQNAIDQTKVVYHLLDAYGLRSALKYIEAVLEKGDSSKPDQKVFDNIRGAHTLHEGKASLSLEEVLSDKSLNERVEKAKAWCNRMGINAPVPPVFINGQPIPKDEDWTQTMSEKLQGDVMVVARYVYENQPKDDTDFAAVVLEGAATRRNTHIFPETEKDIKLINIAEMMENKDVFARLPRIDSDKPDDTSATSIWVVGDFDEEDGYDLLKGAADLQKDEAGVNLVLVNNPQVTTDKSTLSTILYQLQQIGHLNHDTLRGVIKELSPQQKSSDFPSVEDVAQSVMGEVKGEGWSFPDRIEASKFWRQCQNLLQKAGIKPGQRAIIVNGRVIGPIAREEEFLVEDFKQLLDYEHEKRIKPVLLAANELGIISKLQNGPLGLAALTNQVALAAVSEAPAGLFQPPDTTRTDAHNKMLQGERTAISVGKQDGATIQIVASIDPASETAQKWVPILKALSEMGGIYVKIFLNPARAISELPVKRFYRHVLASKPAFDDSGRLTSPRAIFNNIPQGPLLSLSMDVPPSWLVTPKESIHDLDNLKLDALKERLRGADIEALYELENILIEGHSRELTGQPPRGAQLVLGTEKEPHFADTIIMANLGYFQFKANPGIWRMTLKEGRSKDIFKIDSFGTSGLTGQRDNEDPDIALMSFQGSTLFPRMSRNPGMEADDVLEPHTAKGAVDKAKQWFNSIVKSATDTAETKPQAEINIFSVASGHLYERFLGIMMLGVMKNTKHSVKFWFIENFLSPSFKDFIPIMAKEYGFEYELVTYKWPHWLRAQKEKQREIWGYKILFLDVLFPLDLDKVIFVDADQIVRTDLKELVDLDLEGAPYGFTPMCDSRSEIEGFRFWKQGYWKDFLRGLPYHISALYVVDLKKFRQIAAGDRLRQQYHQLSADPHSLANLDQDLPNHMQSVLPIKSLPQDWLWCETWCSDESLKTAKTIDLCNNPMTKEPKLDRARRQVPEWTAYDQEVARLAKKVKGEDAGHLSDSLKEEKKEKVEIKDEL